MTHNDMICPKYNEAVLPNEEGNCSLCNTPLDKTIDPTFELTGKTSQQVVDRAKNQAQAQFEGIKELMTALYEANETKDQTQIDEALEEIYSNALSTGVIRQYEILLCTGGPAVRIIGELDEYLEPETAVLQYQDWGTFWQDYSLSLSQQELLLDFAHHHYFQD